MKKYILSLDEGTTSARAILFNKNAEIVSMSQHEIPQIFPAPGMVEQNPMDIYGNQYAAMSECIAKSGINPEEIAGIGITTRPAGRHFVPSCRINPSANLSIA